MTSVDSLMMMCFICRQDADGCCLLLLLLLLLPAAK